MPGAPPRNDRPNRVAAVTSETSGRRSRWFGLLNLNKPTGVTSRGVVNRVQRLVRPAKVGHAGTLDPLASGVLLVCLGPATRLVDYLHRFPKHYRASFLLGRESPTEDVDGEVTELDQPPVPGRAELVRAAESLTGEIQQRPPAFSALKVRGRRAYDFARRGSEVELAPRQVTVHRLQIIDYDYPRLDLAVECSTGTYVRSLGRDLAQAVGTSAVMTSLVRTAIGPFQLEEAHDPDRVDADTLPEMVLPPQTALGSMPSLTLRPEEVGRVQNGAAISRQVPAPDAPELAGLDPAGNLVAILARQEGGRLRPVRTFPTG